MKLKFTNPKVKIEEIGSTVPNKKAKRNLIFTGLRAFDIRHGSVVSFKFIAIISRIDHLPNIWKVFVLLEILPTTNQ
jgi:hypothetical protein